MRLRWERAPILFQVVYSPPPLLFSFFSASWGTTRRPFLRAHTHKSKYPPSPFTTPSGLHFSHFPETTFMPAPPPCLPQPPPP